MLETHEGIRPHAPPPHSGTPSVLKKIIEQPNACLKKKKKKERLPHPEWVGGVSVRENFLKQVPGRCSLARVKFFSRKNVS